MKKLIGLGLSLLALSGVANALEVGVGLKAGTLGAGIDLSVALTQTVNLRAALTSVNIDGEEDTLTVGDDGAELDIEAELDADYGASAILVDWYIFNGTFHLTAGMLKNNGSLDFSGMLIGSGTIDGQAFDAGDLVGGEIGGKVSLGDSYQPYLGIGWGRKASYDPGFSISVEIGVALLDPDVDFDAAVIAGGNFVGQAELDVTLQDAEDDAEDELDEFELFPILSLGINYAF